MTTVLTRRALLNQLGAAAALGLLPGCGERPQTSRSITRREEESEFYLTILLDLSASFSGLMAEQGKAYAFARTVLDRYFKGRSSLHDRLVIGQISGSESSLLWNGTAAELYQDYPSDAEFRDYLREKADPNGSLVHAGINHALNYVMSTPRVASGQAQAALFVLSDLVDTGPDPERSEQELVRSLGQFAQLGGIVGFYYVHQSLYGPWQQRLSSLAFSDYCLESDIVGRPTLPDFDV